MIEETILKWIIPTLLAAFFGYITKELKENRSNNISMKNGMVILLRSQITGKAEKYIELGYIPDYARSCIEDLFAQYEALGGNHGVGKLVEQCFELPPVNIIRKKEE